MFVQGLVEDAQDLWDLIRDPDYMEVNPLPQDAHVKLWQLSKPSNLHLTEEVNCIIIEDGQDFSGATLDVFLWQTSGPLIIFGDPFQQISQLGKLILVLI